MITADGTKWKYSFQNEQGQPIGRLVLPNGIAMPENVSTKGLVPSFLHDYVKIFVGENQFVVSYEIVGRETFNNDLRFNLVSNGNKLATALVKKVTRAFKWPPYVWPPIEIECGNKYMLDGNGFFGFKFSLNQDESQVGSLSEKSGFVLRRKFFIQLPDELSDAQKFFIFFLAVNRAFR